mmetsp:Transcript_68151/g.131642  ORF Transcript_68151/g.131642 Transcript_68151/m.131642 type:complete len:443 (+) Transcript_68151:116-1444(+)
MLHIQQMLSVITLLVLCFAIQGAEGHALVKEARWHGNNMKMTHYWDCNGQGCDATTLQPWMETRYISPPGYGPQDPMDFGGPLYGEKMWLTGAASDALSQLMGDDDGCCGGDPNDGGVGGCGKCVLVQNPLSLHPDWTAIVMKKNRCPPWSHGCGAGQPHFDIAAPGFDNLQYSTANVCGSRPKTGFDSKQQSAVLGSWYTKCQDTAKCAYLCNQLPPAFQKGCKLFASWGWKRGDPSTVKYRAVTCPPEFQRHVGAQFGPKGAVPQDPVPKPNPSPTPKPKPKPRPSPAPSPTSKACIAYCSKTNFKQTKTKSCGKVKNKNECLAGYMQAARFNKGKVTPCAWSSKKQKCRPNKKKSISCPGFPQSCPAQLLQQYSNAASIGKAGAAQPKPLRRSGVDNHRFLSPSFSSSHVTSGKWFLQNQSQLERHALFHEKKILVEEL